MDDIHKKHILTLAHNFTTCICLNIYEKLSFTIDSQYKFNFTIFFNFIKQQLKIKEFPFKIKDKNGKDIYYQSANGFWVKREYDSNGNHIYTESSYGTIYDNRPKTEIQKAIDLLTKEGLIVDGKILKN